MTVDPYSPNPLAQMVHDRDPIRYDQVAAVKDPPKLFAGGASDVPLFTASGIDPQLLLKLPYGMRHAAAANPNITQVHGWFEEYADVPDAEVKHEGLDAAKLRIESWLRDTDLDPRSLEQRVADDAKLYEEFENHYFPDAVRTREREAKRAADWQEAAQLERRAAQLRTESR